VILKERSAKSEHKLDFYNEFELQCLKSNNKDRNISKK